MHIHTFWHSLYSDANCTFHPCIQLFQLRLSTSKAEKSNTSAKGCWESLWKFIKFLAIPSSLSRSYSTFPLCSWTTLIEIAVYTTQTPYTTYYTIPNLTTSSQTVIHRTAHNPANITYHICDGTYSIVAYFKSWLLAVLGSPTTHTLTSPRRVVPSRVTLGTPPNNINNIPRLTSSLPLTYTEKYYSRNCRNYKILVTLHFPCLLPVVN
jgi:hypothetical protein